MFQPKFNLPGLDTIGTEESLNLLPKRRGPTLSVDEVEAWETTSPSSPELPVIKTRACPQKEGQLKQHQLQQQQQQQKQQQQQQKRQQQQQQQQQRQHENSCCSPTFQYPGRQPVAFAHLSLQHSTVASSDHLDLNLQGLETKLALIAVQRSVSAIKCEIFLEYLEAQRHRIMASNSSVASSKAEGSSSPSSRSTRNNARHHVGHMTCEEAPRKLPFPCPVEATYSVAPRPRQCPGKPPELDTVLNSMLHSLQTEGLSSPVQSLPMSSSIVASSASHTAGCVIQREDASFRRQTYNHNDTADGTLLPANRHVSRHQYQMEEKHKEHTTVGHGLCKIKLDGCVNEGSLLHQDMVYLNGTHHNRSRSSKNRLQEELMDLHACPQHDLQPRPLSSPLPCNTSPGHLATPSRHRRSGSLSNQPSHDMLLVNSSANVMYKSTTSIQNKYTEVSPQMHFVSPKTKQTRPKALPLELPEVKLPGSIRSSSTTGSGLSRNGLHNKNHKPMTPTPRVTLEFCQPSLPPKCPFPKHRGRFAPEQVMPPLLPVLECSGDF